MNRSRVFLILSTVTAVLGLATGSAGAQSTEPNDRGAQIITGSSAPLIGSKVAMEQPISVRSGGIPEVPTAAATARPTPKMRIDPTSRSSVVAAYQQWYKPALSVPVGWRGNVAACDAGMPSTAGQNATIDMVNYFREMVHIDPVRFDATLSAKAQQAALIMAANDALSHYPPSSWKCWSETGFDGASHSNLYLGVTGAAAVAGYMVDPGSNNLSVGHRRWITAADQTLMGSGSTNFTNALWVVGESDTEATVPTVVAWPSPGYFPSALEPLGRWSFNIPDAGPFDPNPFENARVTVRETTGKALPVTIVDSSWGYGMGTTIVFEVGGISLRAGHADKGYRVTISGIDDPRFPPDYTYYVTMVDADVAPADDPGTPTTKPMVVGAAEGISAKGSTVTFYGWAYGVGRNAEVVISRNGATLGSLVATRPRSDGKKGWQYQVNAAAGTYKYCAHFSNPSASTGWTTSCSDVVVK